MTRNLFVVSAVGIAALAIGCGSDRSDATDRAADQLPHGSEAVELDPADFTTQIDNPYWPMKPGSRWLYREGEAGSTAERVVVTVTSRTKKIANGVVARVIHDLVTKNGKLVENTYDWYAQDRAGNVWYFGEAVKNYKNGKFSDTHGSWQAGVHGAQAGVVIPAHPRVGMGYRQEYYEGHAEDAARVLSIDEKVEVPFGFYTGGLMTKDYSPLEPRLVELKFYARNVGPVLTLTVSGGSARGELLRFDRGGR